ncbi:MAG TPA: LLM class flavin-dependent oxidoreductase, partial [Acetobacteraceae bacterium]|nr:LLM class flavin-dependent oxidoreductase [Acetobacteraceae bacterium]
FRHNVRDIVADIRAQAKAIGRDPYDMKMFVGATVIVAPTDAEAQDKLAEYREYASSEGALAHYSASVGVDFSRYGPDEPIRFVRTNALRSNLEAITVRSGGTEWTLRKLLGMMVLGSRQAPIVGSPSRVADEMQAWVDEADVDGFNLSRSVIPECVEDFVAFVVPELQARGVMKREYAAGSLRQKLFGASARLPPSHPAARCRR